MELEAGGHTYYVRPVSHMRVTYPNLFFAGKNPDFRRRILFDMMDDSETFGSRDCALWSLLLVPGEVCSQL